jgi:hypothetical protein
VKYQTDGDDDVEDDDESDERMDQHRQVAFSPVLVALAACGRPLEPPSARSWLRQAATHANLYFRLPGDLPIVPDFIFELVGEAFLSQIPAFYDKFHLFYHKFQLFY